MPKDEEFFVRVATSVILIFLIALSFLILKPILLSVITGLILAFIFNPVYGWVYKKINMKNTSALIIVLLLIIIVIIPLWFLLPVLINQSFKIFQATLQIDLVTPLKTVFPQLFKSEQLSGPLSSVLSTFATKVANSVTVSLTNILLNFPTVSLQLLVVLFTFFFVMRDREEFLTYIKSLLPFPKETEKKLFEYSTDLTKSVLYGQILIGFLQGFLAGIGFIVFGVPNALFLTGLAILAGVLPVIGTPIVWIPVAIFMFIAGNNLAGWGIIIFGILSSIVEHILRPLLVARMTKVHSAVVLIGMIGGLFFFGVLGFILGPLIISYLLIILELFRKKPVFGNLLVKEPQKK